MFKRFLDIKLYVHALFFQEIWYFVLLVNLDLLGKGFIFLAFFSRNRIVMMNFEIMGSAETKTWMGM